MQAVVAHIAHYADDLVGLVHVWCAKQSGWNLRQVGGQYLSSDGIGVREIELGECFADYGDVCSTKDFLARESSSLQQWDAEDGEIF